ncbi:DUF4350 domain-containing protein [Rossellomorea vietnamensis]|uniref:DUF4350 domain-containing protein n=1 Tax=Rossellomorea vietnamensis TaxID=218284 RepID=A0A6I6UBN6_9BACI|nr:DUF4350 domain-containing protein [Rossellomorea vietnamensis]QHE60104.1 DUF4350 domain-containing protein [Rossellomorea vietnamensis]
MKLTIKRWIPLVGLLGVFIVIGVFLSPEKLKEYPAYVSESPSPTGIKALYTYLENEGVAISRWSLSPDRLSKKETGQLLIMAEPFTVPDQEEMEEYEDFMRRGNTILLLKDNPKGMFDIKTEMIDSPILPLVRDGKGNTYETDTLSGVRLEEEAGDKVLLDDVDGTIAYKTDVGQGSLIVSTTPAWMTNGSILEKDHLSLILLLLKEAGAQEGTILFDEFLHGGESRASLATLYPQWLLLLLLQSAIFTLLGLWMQGKRFGGILTPREETVRFSDERIKALSAWYLKGKQYKASLLIQSDYVRLLFQERWGIPTSKEWGDLKEPLERRVQTVSEKEIASFLMGIKGVLNKERINKQEYIMWSKRLELFRKEVEDR